MDQWGNLEFINPDTNHEPARQANAEIVHLNTFVQCELKILPRSGWKDQIRSGYK